MAASQLESQVHYVDDVRAEDVVQDTPHARTRRSCAPTLAVKAGIPRRRHGHRHRNPR